MSQQRKKIGKIGEDLAASFLTKKGYKILERNWRCFLGEIDIIAQKDKIWVFCEVKTKSNENFGLPEEMVGSKKQKKLKELAEFYLKEKDLLEKKVIFRIDVVAVDLIKEEIRLIENAVES